MRASRGVCYRGVCSASNADPFDVVIVGGGIVGAALACRLGSSPVLRENFRIAVIETVAPKPLADVQSSDLPDLRSYSMTPANIDFFC